MKKNIILSLLLLLSGVVLAQEKGHYVYLNAGGGLNNLSYTVTDGTVKSGLGFTGNLGYNYFFTPNFGIGTGLGIQSFKSIATLNYMTSNPATDADGDAYDYRIYYANWQETQNLLSLDVPLSFSYQTKFNDKSGMMVSLGAKVSVPIITSYKSTAGEIDTRGYYQQWNVELSDMPQHDFYTLNSITASNFVANISYSAFIDLGYLHNLSKNMDLYLGLYGNYGLSNVINPETNLVYQQDGVYNGVLASDQTSKANLFSVGVKLGINLHLPSKHKIVNEDNQNIVNNDNPEVVPDNNPVNTDTTEVEPNNNLVNTDTTEVEPNNNLVNTDTTEVEPDNNVVIVDTVIIPIEEKLNPIDRANKISTDIKINFLVNSNVPIISDDDKMKELAQLLIENPNMKILAVGHTSTGGSKEINIKIGMQRAESVKKLFMTYGVPENQIITETKYYIEPIVPNNTAENKVKNQRVDLFIK